MTDESDVLIVGSGMAAAAVHRSLHGSGRRVTTLEAGPAVSAGGTHLRNLLPHGDAGWRTLVSAMTAPPVRAGAERVANLPPAGAFDRVRSDQPIDAALPGLAACCGVGGNALVWSGIVLPPSDDDAAIDAPELAQAASWLGAQTVAGSPRQAWLCEAHGLTAVPLAWSAAHGWHGPQELAGDGFSPLPVHAAHRIVHEHGRAIGVEVCVRGATDRRLVAARDIVICAGVVGTVRLLWASGLGPDLPGLGRRIAHHPVAVAQVAMVPSVWASLAERPRIEWPAAARVAPALPGAHTLVVAEPPWMADGRVDARATLSIYAYATLEPDAGRHLSFAPEQAGPDGLALPRFVVPRTAAERACEELALDDAKTWAARLGAALPAGRPRVLPRGADQHLAGGACIGGADDPLAAADLSGRLRGLDNVWIAGAAALPAPVSTHPTQALVALAARVGRALTSR